MSFRLFRSALILRRIILFALIAIGACRLGLMAAGALSAPQRAPKTYSMGSINIPYTVCKESTMWTRPTPEQQAKVWNDSRYPGRSPRNTYAWTHEFLLVPADSTDMQGTAEDEAGLWTEGTFGQKCDDANYKHNDQWVMAWILFHRVRSIQVTGGVYTIKVEPTAKGFQSIIFKRLAPKMNIRFVDQNGKVLEEVKD
jgi:hypothetical protein